MIRQHVAELIERMEAGLKENHDDMRYFKSIYNDRKDEPEAKFYKDKLDKLKEENQKLVGLIEYLEKGLKDLKD